MDRICVEGVEGNVAILFYFIFKYFIYLFLERRKGRNRRRREGEKEGEKHPCVVASHAPHPGDLACNPGLCPDYESNHQPFGSQAGTQFTEPHQPGCNFKIAIRESLT